MPVAARTAVPQAAPTEAPTASSTAKSRASTTRSPTVIFQTPALTTTFTPPPECTSQHLTMLQSEAYFVWLNEPQPVPDATFSSCYPDEFMTSYLQEKSSTIVPPFSPLVCPDNYYTVFNQTFTDRPLYVACCPSSFGFHPPETSTPGRPAYGGTCYSDILSTTITQYDNSSSSGVMTFTTSGQAYGHPIDGFAMNEIPSNVVLATDTSAAPTGDFRDFPTESAAPASVPASSSSGTSPGIIAAAVIAPVTVLALVGALFLFWRRSHKLKKQLASRQTQWPSDAKLAPASIMSSDKGLPPVPPYGAAGGRSKLSEAHSSTTWVQELPSQNMIPQELAVVSPRPQPHIITAARESAIGNYSPHAGRSNLSSRRHSPPPPAHSPDEIGDEPPQFPSDISYTSPSNRSRGYGSTDVISPLDKFGSASTRAGGRGRQRHESSLGPISPESDEEDESGNSGPRRGIGGESRRNKNVVDSGGGGGRYGW